ncbi:Dihydropteroate synthase [Tilletiaria anomala UBC 951]|uniref:Dihydropteroate synthase n=1 Tax=Tilletiaria anomala (strain ATCC 24038 / CBS 436.72 / UBC 951) TaxID=1037660 RepID=A0A066VFT4_TILAU|nr:Dihydropteroate synthase [Tilletiaria anomala UBC 951]KDN40602.1 Dihydropteroate synthase [Tilletiaria anomala UBC 951]
MAAPASSGNFLAARDGTLPDLIVLSQLEVRMHVGVDNWERASPQPVLIDAYVHTDVCKAGKSDHLPHSIHYGILTKELEKHCSNSRYRSLEALADGLAKVCLFICHAPRVTLRVQKPRCLLHAHSAGVEVVRTADDFVNGDGTSVDSAALDLATSSSAGSASRPSTALSQLRLSPRSKWVVHDKVFVRDLIVNTIVGVNPWERFDKQNIKLNLTIFSGSERLRQAAAAVPGQEASTHASKTRDIVSRPHNYRTIVRSISEYVEASSYKTVESLATSIARVAIQQNKVDRIRVSVAKPSAIMFAASAGVEIERDRAFFEEEALLAAADSHLDTVSKSSLGLPTVEPRSLEGASASSPVANVLEGDGWHLAAIALGSNLGDRIQNIEKAVRLLSAHDSCKVVDTSFLYETPPMYVTDQPTFLNGACRIATKLAPHDLLTLTQSIETAIGRDKAGVPDKGPRLVDLDILFYDRAEVDDGPRLTIPHPLMKEREFVLRPLADILPNFEHPSASRTVAQLLSILQNSPDYEGGHGIRKVTFVPTEASTSTLSWGSRTYVMGIINATPDSFSDGGDNLNAEPAIRSAMRMVEQGVDILDVGGMSTAPHAEEVDEAEEVRRTAPLIQSLRAAGITQPISIDTFRAGVASAALQAGANIINDVSGGERDPAILKVARDAAVPFICMHMRGDSQTMEKMTSYAGGDVIAGVKAELQQRVDRALRAGVRRWNIILDPGLGFAKCQEGNLQILRNLSALTATAPGSRTSEVRSSRSGLTSRASHSSLSQLALTSAQASPHLTPRPEIDGTADLITPNSTLAGFPMLAGPSRKRFIGSITGRKEPKERVYGTAAACTAAIANGVDILRVHDVEEMVDVVKTSDAIFR